MNHKNPAVFILLGQSNAVGHGIPMKEEGRITEPLKNVFGLNREMNQSFENDNLYWGGYTSSGMNLAEEQDDTYSVANCLAKLWQSEIDSGRNLSDLYIVHIAIGAQGVTDGFMWNSGYEKKLVPGKLGTVDISLSHYTNHILSLVKKSLGEEAEIIGIHWRGGEEDTTVSKTVLENSLKDVYNELFDGFYNALGRKPDIILHRIVCPERCLDMDPTGKSLENMNYINEVFEQLSRENENIAVFDVRKCPMYIPDKRGNGIFIEDAVHFTPEVNGWVAQEIMKKIKQY